MLERLSTTHESELRVLETVRIDHESTVKFPSTIHERNARLAFVVFNDQERLERVVLVVERFEVRVMRFPERVFTVVLRFERLVLVVLRFHESEFTLDPSVLRLPERELTVVNSVARFPERDEIVAFIVATVPERAFCALASVK